MRCYCLPGFWALCWLIAGYSAAGSATERIPLTQIVSLETQLLADAADGRLDRFSLLQAALVSGGVDREADVAAYEHHLATKWREIADRTRANHSLSERAAWVMAGMHRLLLTGNYEADCTELHRTLQSGNFNCVTASVLFLELSRQQGVASTSVAVPGHVYCRTLQERPQDVQTTCRDWFDILHGKTVSRESEALLKTLATKQHEARPLSDVALLGKVYYNRGVTALEQRDYSNAITLLEKSLQLDTADAPAKNNLIAAYNNWALELCDAGEHAAAAEKLKQGHRIDPEYGPLLTNDLHVHQKWVMSLCERGKHAAALELLEAGYTRRPQANLYDGGRFAVIGLWLKAVVDAHDVPRMQSMLASTRERYGEHPEFQRQSLAVVEAKIHECMQSQRHSEAQALLQVAQQHLPYTPSLQALDSQLRNPSQR
jgi:tetratricopeptide (TPR) repeat protein